MPLRDIDLSLNAALERAARQWPDRIFLKIEGQEVTFKQFDDQVGRLAGGLKQVGLGPGDRLLVLMRNSLQCVETWFAANRLGAAWAPINTEFKGVGLEHVVRLADAKVFVSDPDLCPLLATILGPDKTDRIFLAGRDQSRNIRHPRLKDLYQAPAVEVRPSHFADLSALLFTSGTTGRSKAAMLSHRYFISQARIAIRDFGLVEDDVLYCPFPLFHADATALTTVPALLIGACAALSPRFSASRFWTEVREIGATVFDFMGATLSILYRADPKPDDADNPARLAWGVPVPAWVEDFERRFNLQVIEVYGSVEANIPVTQRFDSPRVKGSCGRVIPEFEVIVADDNDEEVAAGTTGEILIRPRIPYTTMTGYFGMPEATAETARNFWFHSGDLGSIDAEGNVYFVGRTKEVIRRRGENIAAFEVEEGVLQHPDIVECAAIGVPSELTEEDVKICVVLRPGSALSAEAIYEHCRRVLARFQVPRYIEIMASLPKTPTGKAEKYRLREVPIAPATWEAPGLPGMVPLTAPGQSA